MRPDIHVPAWQRKAACLGHNAELFDTELKDHNGARAARAKAVCDGCPVKTACLVWALEHEQGAPAAGRAGIWGGLTPTERAALTRRQPR